MTQGRYVSFEGIEGAGKSTIAAMAAQQLREVGMEVVEVREPGGTDAGEQIRSVLLDGDAHLEPWAEALLFAAARAQLAAEVIRPALARGAWVVGDRSVYSSLAYQGGGRRLGIESVEVVNKQGLQGTWPDHVVLLRVDVEIGLLRQDTPDRIGSEGAEFQTVVAEAFDLLAKLEPDRFIVVEAQQPLAQVVVDVMRQLLGLAQ